VRHKIEKSKYFGAGTIASEVYKLALQEGKFRSPDLSTEGMYTPRSVPDDPLNGMIASTLFYAGDDSATAKEFDTKSVASSGNSMLCQPGSRPSGYLCRRELGI